MTPSVSASSNRASTNIAGHLGGEHVAHGVVVLALFLRGHRHEVAHICTIAPVLAVQEVVDDLDVDKDRNDVQKFSDCVLKVVVCELVSVSDIVERFGNFLPSSFSTVGNKTFQETIFQEIFPDNPENRKENIN